MKPPDNTVGLLDPTEAEAIVGLMSPRNVMNVEVGQRPVEFTAPKPPPVVGSAEKARRRKAAKAARAARRTARH